ncbi:hypothetical protein RRG08_062460 [Elysia crispata]|uniref:Uncharacterized protein n=1 Tax=Elysia crispata TaxID=231223 RepID=A0AAE1CJX8_9GAST|nr:hypothetical protein RRG08_062460 [Elysia crispata]
MDYPVIEICPNTEVQLVIAPDVSPSRACAAHPKQSSTCSVILSRTRGSVAIAAEILQEYRQSGHCPLQDPGEKAPGLGHWQLRAKR